MRLGGILLLFSSLLSVSSVFSKDINTTETGLKNTRFSEVSGSAAKSWGFLLNNGKLMNKK